jgi:excisionase family DNA binding protein
MPRTAPTSEPDPHDKDPSDDSGMPAGVDLEEARAVRDQIEAFPEVLTAEEAAVVLRMSEGALLRLCRTDAEVPARKVGGSWRFSKSELLAWISGGRDAGTPLRS